MAKLACFAPSAFSLRSNFPKLVFGHLHLDIYLNFRVKKWKYIFFAFLRENFTFKKNSLKF